jgi:hypothetical protein
LLTQYIANPETITAAIIRNCEVLYFVEIRGVYITQMNKTMAMTV